MGEARRSRPAEVLRSLALSFEHLASQGVASGMVHGVAEELRKELPEVDGQLRALVQDTLTVLGRLAHEAAEREAQAPGSGAQTLAAALTRGTLEELDRQWQDGGLPFHAFAQRLNVLFDRAIDLAGSRAQELKDPSQRAHRLTRSAVAGAVEGLHEDLPALAEDLYALGPVSAELAERVGRGLATGVQARLREDPQALGDLLEHAGRRLVRGLAAGLREELKQGVPEAALGARLEALAERTAAAAVRGAGAALEAQELSTSTARTARTAGRELTRGVLEALSPLRRPLVAAAGSVGALLALAFASTRLRRA